MSESNTWERTFVLIKPDGVKRALMGTIVSRFERAGLTVTGMKMLTVDTEKAEKHYESHRGKSFFEPLVLLLCSGPVTAMALEGAHAISVVRKIVGSTEPREAAPGTIRGDFCHMGYERSRERLGVIPNLIHASDSPESAEWELNLWFTPDELVAPYDRTDARFM
jgi:nucleoside-diphosphate kinase